MRGKKLLGKRPWARGPREQIGVEKTWYKKTEDEKTGGKMPRGKLPVTSQPELFP